MSGLKKGTGDATHHGDNKQNERGAGVKNHPLKKSTANTLAPIQSEAKPTSPRVHMTPKINAGTGGKKDGAKRIINSEAKPAGRNSTGSTYTAPRKEGSKDPMERGYTKL